MTIQSSERAPAPSLAGLQILRAARLTLAALPRPALAALYAGTRPFETMTGVHLACGLLDDETRRATARKLSRLQDEPATLHAWNTYWLVLIQEGDRVVGAGLVGFKGAPNASGEVELAYSVAPDFRGRGLATDAAAALLRWGFSHAACRAVIAPDTPRANIASGRVLEKLGMQVYASSARAQSWRVERRDRTRPAPPPPP